MISARLRRRNEGGFSLAEVLVAMIVMSLLGTAIVSMVSSVARGSTAATNRLQATTRGATITDRLTKYIRAAHLSTSSPQSPIILGDTNHITFQSDFGDATGPRRVDVALSGSATSGTLTETYNLADVGSAYSYTGPAKMRTLAYADLNTVAGGIFTYYDATGTALTGLPLTTLAQTTRVARVRITLTTQEPGVAAPVTLSTLVYLRNVEYR